MIFKKVVSSQAYFSIKNLIYKTGTKLQKNLDVTSHKSLIV